MKIVNEMPKTGSFVMVWKSNNDLYSDSFKYIDGVLHVWCFDDEEDILESWVEEDISVYHIILNECNPKFIVN